MKLYKNVDICDLNSILTNGILSLDESGNDNWENGKRANNATDKVYLFKPISDENSFPKYGAALVEVEADAVLTKTTDAYEGRYEEYISGKIKPEQIRAVYIPEIFRSKVTLESDKIKYVGIKANWYDEDNGVHHRAPITPEALQRFADTANIECASDFNYFRGVTEKNHMIDLYDIHYEI